ncbi:MAG: glycosyltransferase family 1 protein [Patescibacteria group bacterium]
MEDLPKNFKEKRLSWPPKYLWTQIRLWRDLWLNPPDLLFVPAHTIPFLPIRKKTRVVVTVHDVGFKRLPRLYKKIQVIYHDWTMRKIRRRADLILTISEFSKREIINLYKADPEKIRVVYLGYDQKKYFFQEDEAVLKKYGLEKPYLLYVGRLEIKKNILNIFRSFILAKKHFPELKLVLAGSGGDMFEKIKEVINTNKVDTEVILPGYIEEKDLPAVISSAEVFLFPTLYEGFGLPIIQALACQTPVLTSDLDPHREVGGDAAVYADPSSPQAMAQEIIQIMSNVKIKEELKEKGLIQARRFSWEKTAKEIWEIFSFMLK